MGYINKTVNYVYKSIGTLTEAFNEKHYSVLNGSTTTEQVLCVWCISPIPAVSEMLK